MDLAADVPLVTLVRWTGTTAAALLLVGPASLLALGSGPAAGGRLAWAVPALGPGIVATAAAGIGYLRLPARERGEAWPAAAAAALAALLLGLLLAWPP